MTTPEKELCECGHERIRHSGTVGHDGYCCAWKINELDYCPCSSFRPAKDMGATGAISTAIGCGKIPAKETKLCPTCGFSKLICECPPTPPSMEWAKRFWLLWGVAPPDSLKYKKGQEIYDFIEVLLQEKDAEIEYVVMKKEAEIGEKAYDFYMKEILPAKIAEVKKEYEEKLAEKDAEIARARKEGEWFDSYNGKLWSTAIQKCFEAPFVEVAMQHLLSVVYKSAKSEGYQECLEEIRKAIFTNEVSIQGLGNKNRILKFLAALKTRKKK